MKVDRLVSIIMLLLDKKRISAQELAELYEVSTRTIYRDIDSINMAGIPVCAIPGVGGGFEIMPNYKIDKKVFSTDDLATILMGLSGMSNIVGDELVNAFTKVKSFIPADRAKDIELKTNQFCIDLSPWMGNKNIQPYLEKIKMAIQENRLLSFNYVDQYGNMTKRKTEPYQLVLKDSHWYFQGYCYNRKDFRLFKLSRISNLEKQEEHFILRDYQKPDLNIAQIVETMQKTIKLRIHKEVIERVLDYCTYDELSPDGEDYYIVNYPFIENDYYYDMLLSLGDKCECLEPLFVREEIKRRIHSMATLYEK